MRTCKVIFLPSSCALNSPNELILTNLTQGTLGVNCTIQNDKPCANGIYVHPKMNAASTFGHYGMGGRDTTTSFIVQLTFILEQNVVPL